VLLLLCKPLIPDVFFLLWNTLSWNILYAYILLAH
jgi:hypothetical protein